MKKLLRALGWIGWPAATGILAAVVVLQWSASRRDEPAMAAPAVTPAPAGAGNVATDVATDVATGGATNVATNVASSVATGSTSRFANGFADAVARAAPSVVNIYTRTRVNTRPPGPGWLQRMLDRRGVPRERIQRSLGSGVIVSDEGLVLTSYHVIDNADSILVLLHDGRSGMAEMIGSDPATDLALLKIGLEDIQAIGLGNPEEARVGDLVLAIGNPYGLGHSVSQGIISALGRHGLRLSNYVDFIQTDAAINKGNSGGALIDTEGRLLGINAANYSRSGDFIGIGLATPSDLAMSVARDLVSFGRVERGWIGMRAEDVATRNSPTPLLLVAHVEPGGPAARAGIRRGDLVTSVDGQEVLDRAATIQQVALLQPGEEVTVGLLRGGRELNVQVTVEVQPAVERR